MIYKEEHKLKDSLDKQCRFCFPPNKDRILYETSNFYVMISLGPISLGHLLIITKEHIESAKNIPMEYRDEYFSLKDRVKEILINQYGNCIFFEHGKSGSSLVGLDHKHCFHMHLHCIPTSIELNSIISKDFDGIEFSDYNELLKSLNKYDRYLYVEDSKKMYYFPTINIRKQYLRFKLAEAIGEESRWNWVENQNWELIEQTKKELKELFYGDN